jgi:hypothetical protein
MTARRILCAAAACAVGGPSAHAQSLDDALRADVKIAMAVDARIFASDRPPGVADRSTAAVRTAALQVGVTAYERLQLAVLMNAVETRSPVLNAWADLAFAPWLRLRVGKFPFPISSERLTPPLSLPFIGVSASSLLLPSADTGAQLHGVSSWVDWNLAVVNGAVAGGSGDADLDSGKDVVARVFVRPLGPGAGDALGVGLGASWGRHRGTAAAPGTTALRTYGGQTFFAFRGAPDGAADGDLVRLVPHAIAVIGPVSLQLDGVLASEQVAAARVAMGGASAIATVSLTGEPARPLAFVPPRRAVHEGGPGALLIAIGVGGLWIEDQAFARAADPVTAASRFHVAGAGLKWYPAPGIAVFVDYGHQWFSAAAGAPRRADEDTIVARTQLVL